MASDVIFTESLGATTALAQSIERVGAEQQKASDDRIAALETNERYVLGRRSGRCPPPAALLLVPTPRRETPQDTREALRALMADGSPAGATLLKPDPAPRASVAPPVRDVVATPETAPPAAAAPGVRAPEPAPDLGGAARPLHRPRSWYWISSDLPALLARAARLLDASGVIVWVADRAGTALFPAVAHGYSAALLARMHSIPRDADNAAAAAWREGAERSVAAQGQAPGALVTPILTAEGCVGVLAAETLNGAERRAATRAVATIIAAQLATFVTTLPASEQTHH